jgi:hypothetical protein
VYLGRFDSPESREKYGRVLAEWLTGNPTEPTAAEPSLGESARTINELILAFISSTP